MRIVVKPAGALAMGGALLAVVSVIIVQPFKASVAANSTLAPIDGFKATKKGDSLFKEREAMEPVNLTDVGKADWICWGVGDSGKFSRKAESHKLISDFNLVQPGKGIRGAGKRGPSRGFQWEDGAPLTRSGVVYPGIHIAEGNGFRFSVKPGDDKPHVLKVYVGGFKAGGDFSAFITDGSPLETRNENIALADGYYSRIYTVKFDPNTSKEELKLVWKIARGDGNVSLQAAALE